MEPEIRARAEQDVKGGRGDAEYDGIGVERTNLDRALNGRDMAALASTGSNYLAFEEYEGGLRDALANLMHFARRYEIDFDEELQRALRDHHVESQLGWDAVPS